MEGANTDLLDEKKQFKVFCLMLFTGAVFTIIYLINLGNTDQVYTDVVISETARFASNKSVERKLVYLLSISGSIIYIVYFLWNRYKYKCFVRTLYQSSEQETDKRIILVLFTLAGTWFFVYSNTDQRLIALILCTLALYMIDRQLILPGLSFWVLCFYGICGLYRAYVSINGESSLSITVVALIPTLFTLFFLTRKNKELCFIRGALVSQILIPGVLLVYTTSKYSYEEEFVTLHTPYKVWLLIIILLISFGAEAVLIACKRWNSCKNIGAIVSFGTCVSIMAFNRFSGTNAIVPSDLHHPFEDIISYSQIIKFGKHIFSEYIPISGLHSLAKGFIFDFFGHGKYQYYYLAQNIYCLFIVILIVTLLFFQVRKECVLLISLLFVVKDYDRYAFVAPIMLLLSCPWLIKRKNLWLKTWFLTSYFHGLYYPVYGAAVCIGFMPLGIWQIVTFIKSKELMIAVKKRMFWFGWSLCVLPVLLNFKCLWGILRHMLAMGGQTVYADGMSRFGQIIDVNFFSYINSTAVRLILYYLFTFLILACIVWVAVVLFLNIGNVRIEDGRIKLDCAASAFSTLAISITLLVSCSYTIIRLDYGSLYARSAGIVYSAFLMFVVIAHKYLKRSNLKMCVLGFAIFIIAADSEKGLLENDGKLTAYYSVPEGYVYIENDRINKLGTCFIKQDIYDAVNTCYNRSVPLDRNQSYFGFGSYGEYYLSDLKGDAVMEIGTVKGYEAARESIELIQKNKTIVCPYYGLDSYTNYYLYNWLLTSGQYIWDSEKHIFIPNDDKIGLKNVWEQNQKADIASENLSMDLAASALGASMNTLNTRFSNQEVGYTISTHDNISEVTFNDQIDGTVADFLYIEYADMDKNYQYILYPEQIVRPKNVVESLLLKKDYNYGVVVTVSWMDENGHIYSINCRMGKGKLLIPLGSGRDWLLNKHDSIYLTISQDGQIIAPFQIQDMRFLKLRGIE